LVWVLHDTGNKKRIRCLGPEDFGCFRKTQKHPTRIQVWGGVSASGKSTPFAHIHGPINSSTYVELLQSVVQPFFGSERATGPMIFQQDNARPHISSETRSYIESVHWNTIPWPPNSPDLSMIEFVWSVMTQYVFGKCHPTNSSELLSAVLAAWEHATQYTITCASVSRLMERTCAAPCLQ